MCRGSTRASERLIGHEAELLYGRLVGFRPVPRASAARYGELGPSLEWFILAVRDRSFWCFGRCFADRCGLGRRRDKLVFLNILQTQTQTDKRLAPGRSRNDDTFADHARCRRAKEQRFNDKLHGGGSMARQLQHHADDRHCLTSGPGEPTKAYGAGR